MKSFANDNNSKLPIHPPKGPTKIENHLPQNPYEAYEMGRCAGRAEIQQALDNIYPGDEVKKIMKFIIDNYKTDCMYSDEHTL